MPLSRADSQRLADRLGIRVDEVALALDAIRFQDHQYWFRTIAERLQIGDEILVDHLISTWMSHAPMRDELQAVVDKIRNAIAHHPAHPS